MRATITPIDFLHKGNIHSSISVLRYVLLSLNWGVEERKIQRMGSKIQCSRLTNNFYFVMHLYIDFGLLEPVLCTRKMQIIGLTSFFTLSIFPNLPLSLAINRFCYSKLNMNIHGFWSYNISRWLASLRIYKSRLQVDYKHILKLSIMVFPNRLHNLIWNQHMTNHS